MAPWPCQALIVALDTARLRHGIPYEAAFYYIGIMQVPWNFNSATYPTVYHYTSVEAARAIVETQSIWLSEYTTMNDPSEFVYARNRLMSLLRDRVIYMDNLARYCMVFAVEGLVRNTGLLLGSLTARRDELSQWRKYASDGGGCVVGIDSAYLVQDAGIAIRTVLYDESEVDEILRIALEVVQEQCAERPDDVETLMDFARHAATDLFSIKEPSYADEREVRISRMLVCAEDGTLRDPGGNRSDGSRVPALPVMRRTGAFGETSYIALPLTRRDGSSAIIDLGLGPTMRDGDQIRHSAFFRSHGVDLWKSTLPYRI